MTRVTSCIRETGSVEQHCDALVTLLESCLHHNLQLSARGEDPPHAKISSDIISCIFLVSSDTSSHASTELMGGMYTVIKSLLG